MSDNKQPFNDRSDAHLISRVCVVELHSFIIEEIFSIATNNNKTTVILRDFPGLNLVHK